jgi:hypothetical protein
MVEITVYTANSVKKERFPGYIPREDSRNSVTAMQERVSFQGYLGPNLVVCTSGSVRDSKHPF